MKSIISKIVCLGALLAVVPAAKADQISFSGGDFYNSTSITFTGASVTPGSATGIFAPFGGAGTTVTFNSFNYAGASQQPTPFNLITANNGSATAYFYVTSYTATYDPGSGSTPTASLDILGNGYYTLGSMFVSNGMFHLTTQGNSSTAAVSFSDTNTTAVAPTPEPNSLMLLGTGLVSTAGMMMRRRRNAAEVA